MFKQTLKEGWQIEHPDNWLRRPDPWEIVRPHERVEVRFNCSFELRNGSLQAVLGRTSSLIGIPYDRPVVGYNGNTVNTLRLWAAAAPDYFDFKEFSSGDFVGAVGRIAHGRTHHLGVLVSGRFHEPGTGTAVGCAEHSFSGGLFAGGSSVRRFWPANSDWKSLPEKAAIQLNDTHPSMAVTELMRILLDEA